MIKKMNAQKQTEFYGIEMNWPRDIIYTMIKSIPLNMCSYDFYMCKWFRNLKLIKIMINIGRMSECKIRGH